MSLYVLFILGYPKCIAFKAAYRSIFGTTIRLSTIMMLHRYVSFFATVFWSLGIWLLLTSRQQLDSIRSGSVALSLTNVSRSSMKFGLVGLILSSCCVFLVAFSSQHSSRGPLSLYLGRPGVPVRVWRCMLPVRELLRLLRCLSRPRIRCLCLVNLVLGASLVFRFRNP